MGGESEELLLQKSKIALFIQFDYILIMTEVMNHFRQHQTTSFVEFLTEAGILLGEYV